MILLRKFIEKIFLFILGKYFLLLLNEKILQYRNDFKII